MLVRICKSVQSGRNSTLNQKLMNSKPPIDCVRFPHFFGTNIAQYQASFFPNEFLKFGTTV